MRICFLADAGTSNTLSYLRYFVERGHEVHCLTLHDPLPELSGVQVTRLQVRRKWEYFLQIPRVRSLVRRIAPDVLVGYRITSYGLLAATSAFHPMVLTTTGFDILWEGGWTGPFRRRLVRYAIHRADLVISWAEHMTQALPFASEAVRRDKVFTLPRGIEIHKFEPGPLAPQDRPPIVVSTRSLKVWYRLDTLLEAFAIARREVPTARLVIVGDGPERAGLETLAGRLGIQDAVTFTGRVDYDRIGEHLAGASVYCSQIAFDGVSASLLEAMSAGVFPIIPDNEANRHWIKDGEGGFLVPYGDVEALAGRIQQALTTPGLRQHAHTINRARVLADGDRRRNMERIELRFRQLSTPVSNEREGA